MSSKKNDLSAFANIKSEGVLSLKEKPVSKPDGGTSRPRIGKSKKAPWEEAGLNPNKKVTVLLRVSEVDRAMLNYIREQTGASASHTLRSLALPEIRKMARDLLKKEGHN